LTRAAPRPHLAIRLFGAVLAKQHDEWAEGRRYLGLESSPKADSLTTTIQDTESEATTTPALTA
jgi:hypothetical protein